MAVLMLAEFNEAKHYLGVLCCHKHEYKDSGHSIRRLTTKKCLGCEKLTTKKWRDSHKDYVSAKNREYREANLEKLADYRKAYYEENKETILQQSHERYQREREKLLEQKLEYYRRNREQILEYKRDFYRKNSERILERGRRYRQLNPEKVKLRAKQNRQVNREAILRRWYRYLQTEKGQEVAQKAKQKWAKSIKGRMARHKATLKRRATMAANHSVLYDAIALAEHLEKFDGKCAYCLCKVEVLNSESCHLDHFIPVSQGGPDAIANLVPACTQCNQSKWCRDPYEWYKSREFFSEKQWRKILNILGKTSVYSQLPLL